MVRRLLFINTNWYSFLSASFLSVSVGLFTSIMGGNHLPVRWLPIAASSALSLLGGLCWGIIAWKLDFIQRTTIARRPGFVTEEWASEAALSDVVVRSFIPKLLAAASFSFLCLAVLPISITFEKPDQRPTVGLNERPVVTGQTELPMPASNKIPPAPDLPEAPGESAVKKTSTAETSTIIYFSVPSLKEGTEASHSADTGTRSPP